MKKLKGSDEEGGGAGSLGGLGPLGEFPELEIMVVKIGTPGLRCWRNLQASV